MPQGQTETLKPVTIFLDGSLHVAMKTRAGLQRVHVSLLYEQAVEKYLNETSTVLQPKPIAKIVQKTAKKQRKN